MGCSRGWTASRAFELMLVALVVFLMVQPPSVRAHALASSTGLWTVETPTHLADGSVQSGGESGEVWIRGRVTVDVSALAAVGAKPLPEALDLRRQSGVRANWQEAHGPRATRQFWSTTTLTVEGGACLLEKGNAAVDPDGETLAVSGTFRCELPSTSPGAPHSVSVYLGFVPLLGDDHQHLARFGAKAMMATAEAPELVLRVRPPSPKPGDEPSRAQHPSSPSSPSGGAVGVEKALGLGDFIGEGVRHIATGWDHILFVLALLLGIATLRQALLVITAFTVAHSMTLVMASLGWLHVPGAVVETGIAVSIAWVALAQLRRGPPGEGASASGSLSQASWALGFGWIHGLGFAGYLASLELFEDGHLAPLLGFNLGVELGQLVIVAVVFPLLRFMARSAKWTRVHQGLCALVASAGIYWAVERLAG